MFELDKSLQESIRPIYKNDFRTIRSILGSYLEKVKLLHVGKKLNMKIEVEVKEFLDAGASVVGDLRDCGYLPKSTRCADPWISNKAISLKTFKILNLFIHKVNLTLSILGCSDLTKILGGGRSAPPGISDLD